ncbi:hypothetical protein LUZ60_016906 [Juncus effusus]|nr:hypothetical protein LUZ60_016906 [Juncus effusus]
MAEPDWSSLPPKLLTLISQNLPDISDHRRLRAVCRRWRSALLLPRLPLLFERSSRNFHDNTKLQFFSLSSRSSQTICLPQASEKWLTGSLQGLMLAFQPKTFALSLLNPFSGKEVLLPPLLKLRKTDSNNFRPKLVNSEGIAVISGFYNKRAFSLLFLQIGDEKWTPFGQPGFGEPDIGGAYCNDSFFINQGNLGSTHVIDSAINAVISVIPPPNHENSCIETREKFGGFDYLVESNGDLLRVFRKSDNEIDYNDCFFEIHRLDFEEGIPNWVKIEGIGDRVLFLERSHGFSFDSYGFDGFRGNCIYFTKHDCCNKYSNEKVLCRYDIAERIIEVLPCRLETAGTWIVPKIY